MRTLKTPPQIHDIDNSCLEWVHIGFNNTPVLFSFEVFSLVISLQECA